MANGKNSYYGDLGNEYPSGSDSFIVGLCTGELASAAVSSSKTVGELMAAGVETVVLALRLGMCVFKVKDLVEANKSASPSWSVLVSGIREQEAQELIQKFGNMNVSSSKNKKNGKTLILNRLFPVFLSHMLALLVKMA